MTGWAMPPGSTRFHYFRDSLALCRALFAGRMLTLSVTDPLPEDCCYWCSRHLDKEKA